MDFVLETDGMHIDPWLEEYVRTTAVFAVWRHDLKIDRMHVSLDRVHEDGGESYVRCALLLVSMGSPLLSSGAMGAEVCEAVQGAADLLEVSLYGCLSEAGQAPVTRLAA